MLLKRVNNLCAQDKKRKENVPSGIPVGRRLFNFLPFYTEGDFTIPNGLAIPDFKTTKSSF